ncbi:MAG: endonuclease [Gammaproteobacteria bacterium]|nr:endonuclease [Gammaproteobacteria bacterium]
MVGAILTQNTSWISVERAIANLKQARLLSPRALLRTEFEVVAEAIRPSGYFRVKSQRLRAYCHWYRSEGGMHSLSQRQTALLRQQLLQVKGVGPETADDILLYAFHRPQFVIDSYTRRIGSRVGVCRGDEAYEKLSTIFAQAWVGREDQLQIFQEYHALLVIHAKTHCRKRPLCSGCPLSTYCLNPSLSLDKTGP